VANFDETAFYSARSTVQEGTVLDENGDWYDSNDPNPPAHFRALFDREIVELATDDEDLWEGSSSGEGSGDENGSKGKQFIKNI
jgi:hypothetical protein